jgi:Icc-related predicted phosphoesterase
MKILEVADFHNDIENVFNFLDKLSLLEFDVIVCPGDFTDYNVPKGFTRIDLASIIVEELKTFKKPIIAVPGNMDYEIIEFLEKEGISVHGRSKIIDNFGFYGFGGAKTPFETPLEPSEEEMRKGLEKAYEEIKNCEYKIQVTHVPPFKTKLDIISSGAHVGSETVRNFIEEKKPIVAICAHIHEARGIDEIGKTKIINSGRFPEGYCGLIKIENGKVEAKIVNLI